MGGSKATKNPKEKKHLFKREEENPCSAQKFRCLRSLHGKFLREKKGYPKIEFSAFEFYYIFSVDG